MELSNDILALKDLVSVLFRRIETLESENAALRVEIAELRLEDAELRSRLNLNSKNSQKAALVVADRQTWEWAFKHICQLADKEEPPPKQGKRGKPKNSKGRNLLNRLLDHQGRVACFCLCRRCPVLKQSSRARHLLPEDQAEDRHQFPDLQRSAALCSYPVLYLNAAQTFSERFPEPDGRF